MTSRNVLSGTSQTMIDESADQDPELDEADLETEPSTDVAVPKKHNWERARRMYVEGIEEGGSVRSPTMQEVAELLDIPPSKLRAKAARDRWTAARQDYAIRATQERLKTRAQDITKRSIEFDDSAWGAARVGVAMVTQRLGQIAQEAPVREQARRLAMEQQAAGLPVSKADLYPAVWSKELVELATALKVFQDVGMRALGTDVQRIELTGEGGGPVEARLNVAEEITRDDSQRLTDLISALRDVVDVNDVESVIDVQIIEDSIQPEE